MPSTSQSSLSSSMNGINEVISALNELDLESLQQDWVGRIWKDKFTECPDALPEAYADKFSLTNVSIEIITTAKKMIKNWLAAGDGQTWEAFKELDYRSLLALLYFYMKNATNNSFDPSSIFLGISATDLYLNLLMIPGSRVYNIFHMSIYEVCLEDFLLYKELDRNHELTVPQAIAIQTELNNLLITFKEFVSKFSLKNEEALKLTLRTLADITRAERNSLIESSYNCNDKTSLLLYTKTAFEVLINLCEEAHGRPCETSRLVFVRIMPNLNLVGGSVVPGMVRWPAQEQNIVRANTLWFIKTCVSTIGQPVYPNIKILIHQLVRTMPTRADLRPKSIDTVLAIISLLPEVCISFGD